MPLLVADARACCGRRRRGVAEAPLRARADGGHPRRTRGAAAVASQDDHKRSTSQPMWLLLHFHQNKFSDFKLPAPPSSTT